MKFAFALCIAGGVALSLAPASADVLKAKVDLKASSEVPANDSSGTGTADVSLDTTSRVLTWTVTYSGLSGAAIGAHFHGPSEPGKNAGIVVPFTTALTSPITGTATLTPTQAADLEAGKWYANIHTQKNPGGEIRGQVMLSK